MKIALVLASILMLSGCGVSSYWRAPYAGEAYSVWDSGDNPPKADGVVTYDPNTPVTAAVGTPNGVPAIPSGTTQPSQ